MRLAEIADAMTDEEREAHWLAYFSADTTYFQDATYFLVNLLNDDEVTTKRTVVKVQGVHLCPGGYLELPPEDEKPVHIYFSSLISIHPLPTEAELHRLVNVLLLVRPGRIVNSRVTPPLSANSMLR